MVARSLYIPVRDGTRLAADLYLPEPFPTASFRIPTILYQTRYWRSTELRAPFRWLRPGEGDQVPFTRRSKEYFARRGYALLFVDVRGTGASFGVSRYPWEAVTVQDSYDLIDWIVAQPWSDGSVVGMGVSFLRTSAELLLATRHPALKGVIPQFNHPDPYTDIAMPGGLFNRRFIHAWTALNAALDQNQIPATYGLISSLATLGVRPVGGPEGRRLLDKAVAEHAANGGIKDLEVNGTFRDERHPVAGYSIDDQAVMRFRDAIMESRVPVFGWASWMDAGTGGAALRRFITYPNPQWAVIGAWNHGGIKQSSPYQSGNAPLSPPPDIQSREILRFLDTCLRPGGLETLQNTLHYYTLGLEAWQKTTQWPPAGFRRERWFIGSGGTLTTHTPESKTGLDFDRYLVDYRASTGTYNRWWELGVIEGKAVDYGNRAAQKPYVLGYESVPLERAVEITGTPVLSLSIESSEADCAFYAYLEDVFPDGRIVCVTEGQLRAIHRKVAPPETSPYRLEAPYHTFRQADAMPLIPGEMTEVTFGLLPTSVRIQRGHRIRLSLAGHDAETFPRIPGHGSPIWTVYHGADCPSFIELPVKEL